MLKGNSLFNPQHHVIASAAFIITEIMIEADFFYGTCLQQGNGFKRPLSIIITALHHIPEPLKVIQEAMRVTRKTIIVVEDLYRNPIGKWWTLVRDQIYNFEFFGHPCQFRKQEEWLQPFRGLKLEVSRVESFYTWLSGLRILNGLFVLRLAEDVCVV